MLHHMVLVLAVLVQASEGPRNHHTRGERGGTTMNVKFIVSVQVVPATFKPLCISSLIVV
jgi:hypothetical protein